MFGEAIQSNGVVGGARVGHREVSEVKERMVRNGKEMQGWVGRARQGESQDEQARQGKAR